MKRTLISAVLVLSLVFSLTLCGCSQSSTEPTAAPAADTTQPSDTAPAGDTAAAKPIKTVKLRMLTDQSNKDVTGALIDKFAAEIESKSNGQLDIEVYHDGQLYKLDQYADAFAAGSIDLAFCQFGKGWPNIIPQMTLLSSAVFETTEHALSALNGDLGAYLGQLLAEKGKVQILGWSGAGCVDCMLNTKHPITKPEDLQGLKLRVPNPGQMAQVEAFGGAGVVISATDMYMAVQKGTVDGVYSTAPGGAMTIKMAEVAKYFTRVAVAGLAIEHGIVMNLDIYNSLPADLQNLLTTTAKTYGEQIIKDTTANADTAWDVLKSKGIELTVIPESDIPAWRAVWAPARDAVLKTVLDQAEIDKLMAMVEAAK